MKNNILAKGEALVIELYFSFAEME